MTRPLNALADEHNTGTRETNSRHSRPGMETAEKEVASEKLGNRGMETWVRF